MNRFVLPVIIERDAESYFAMRPTLRGCYTQGDSYEKVLLNSEDAIHLYIDDLLASGETVPTTGTVSLTTVEISV